MSSFVAAYISHPDRIVYIDVANQHPDTLRFVADCQKFLDVPIEFLRDTDYAGCVDVVIETRKYINGPSGAPCTMLLKKRVRQEFERTLEEPPTYIWGFDAGEKRRAERLVRASEWGNEFPLIEKGLTKADCHGFIMNLGLKRPFVYDLGFPSGNCLGCVKGGKGYWNKVRKRYPKVFERRARQEREIGRSCIKGTFLDELGEGEGRDDEVFPECSIACMELEEANED